MDEMYRDRFNRLNHLLPELVSEEKMVEIIGKYFTEDGKVKQQGFRLKDDVSFLVIVWMYTQSNFSASIRYLIEREIEDNGIRNLAKIMTVSRDIEEIVMEKGTFSPFGRKDVQQPPNRDIQHFSRVAHPQTMQQPILTEVRETTSVPQVNHSVKESVVNREVAVSSSSNSDSRVAVVEDDDDDAKHW